MKHLLIVDDDPGCRESLRAVFGRAYELTLAADAREALEALGRRYVDLVLLDVLMPGKDGLTLLAEVLRTHPDLPVIMLTACASVRAAVEAIRLGAFDYVTKPFDVVELRALVERALERRALHHRVEAMTSDLSRAFPVHDIVGEDPVFAQALHLARQAAETDAAVLLGGEPGTGKELVARMIHSAGPRREEPFVAVQCAALPAGLLESELFGEEQRAAADGARRAGRFDLAGSGTLFFDEIDQMPAPTQAKLVRVLQDREFQRIGGARGIPTRARVVAASTRNLREEVSTGRFRGDLFYALAVVPILLPALRDRPGDIPLLAQHFLTHFRAGLQARAEKFAADTLDRMNRYPWPGNVHELRSVVERMLVLHRADPVLLPRHLPAEFGGPLPPPDLLPFSRYRTSLAATVDAYEKEVILRALQDSGGVQTRAAELLGTTRRILKYRMEKLKIHG